MESVEVTRSLRHRDDGLRMRQLLQGLPGVLAVEERSPLRLRIRYDVLKTDYGTLYAALAQAGVAMPVGRLARWRCAWYAFQDANLRDNAGYRPACCSKPPPGAGRRQG